MAPELTTLQRSMHFYSYAVCVWPLGLYVALLLNKVPCKYGWASVTWGHNLCSVRTPRVKGLVVCRVKFRV